MSTISPYSYERRIAISEELKNMWLARGAVPDMAGIATVSTTLEGYMPSWIGPQLLRKAIVECVRQKDKIPAPAHIIAAASEIRRAEKPAATTEAKKAHCCPWCPVVAHRLMRHLGTPFRDNAHQWESERLAAPPTAAERECFITFVRENNWNPDNGRGNPYGVTWSDVYGQVSLAV